jgi:hypothetical protein
MAEVENVPPEAVAVLRAWCKHHRGLVAWCGVRCERPGGYPVDVFFLLRQVDEDGRERLALDLHDYLSRSQGPDNPESIFPQMHLSREEYLEELGHLGIREADVRPVWPAP